MAAAPWVVDDRLWDLIKPLLPVKPPGRPGPDRMDERLVLQGILFVLFTGIGWEDLPREVVEQTLALLHQFRPLATRWERHTDIPHDFLTLAATLIYWRRLQNPTY